MILRLGGREADKPVAELKDRELLKLTENPKPTAQLRTAADWIAVLDASDL
jgi:hypothetical protein